MSERYNKLFSLPENMYTVGSPAIIEAGALYKDNNSGKVIGQLKIKSISPKIIKAAKVLLSPLDTVGAPLGQKVLYEYLDLNVKRDEEFGTKIAIPFENTSTRAFHAEVTEVAYSDNTVDTFSGHKWEALPGLKPLKEILIDEELVKQHSIKYKTTSIIQPEKVLDLWFCTCGAINDMTEEKCHACGCELDKLLSCDIEELGREKDERLAKENAEREEKEIAEKEAASKKKRKTRAFLISAAAIIVLILGAIVGVSVHKTNMEKTEQYEKALMLAEEKQYSLALHEFSELGSFKDSAKQAKEIQSEQEQARQRMMELLVGQKWTSEETEEFDISKDIYPKYATSKVVRTDEIEFLADGHFNRFYRTDFYRNDPPEFDFWSDFEFEDNSYFAEEALSANTLLVNFQTAKLLDTIHFSSERSDTEEKDYDWLKNWNAVITFSSDGEILDLCDADILEQSDSDVPMAYRGGFIIFVDENLDIVEIVEPK